VQNGLNKTKTAQHSAIKLLLAGATFSVNKVIEWDVWVSNLVPEE